MTSTRTGPTDPGASPVDRRWFEDALRSQGFIVAPPPESGAPDTPEGEAPDTPEGEAPGTRATGAPDTPESVDGHSTAPLLATVVASDIATLEQPWTAGSSDERPPVPSALLARIAARGQVATPETTIDASAPAGTTAPAGPIDAPPVAPLVADAPPITRVEQWANAVVADVAPWSSSSEPEASVVGAPPATPDAVPAAVSEHPPAPMAAPMATPVPGPASAAPPAVASAPVSTPAAAIVPIASSAQVVATEAQASEGELWALVGGSESTTQAHPSDAVRLVLTILTAFVVLVIVVGSLILASQIA